MCRAVQTGMRVEWMGPQRRFAHSGEGGGTCWCRCGASGQRPGSSKSKRSGALDAGGGPRRRWRGGACSGCSGRCGLSTDGFAELHCRAPAFGARTCTWPAALLGRVRPVETLVRPKARMDLLTEPGSLQGPLLTAAGRSSRGVDKPACVCMALPPPPEANSSELHYNRAPEQF